MRIFIEEGSWSAWDAWTSCTSTCGGGTQTRKKTCNKPVDSDKLCSFEEPQKNELNKGEVHIETKQCNIKKCPGIIYVPNILLTTQSHENNKCIYLCV